MAAKGKAFNILIAGALVMAVATFFVFNMWSSNKARKAAMAERTRMEKVMEAKIKELNANSTVSVGERVPVLFAMLQIPPAAPITPEMTTVKEVPKDLFPEGSIIPNFEALQGRMARVAIEPGDVILAEKLITAQDFRRPSYKVAPGKRFMTLLGTPEDGYVSGTIRIGDEVDVLASYGDGERTLSRIIIQRAKVIDVPYGDQPGEVSASNPEVPAEAPPRRIGVTESITLEVTPEEAELFRALQSAGISYQYLLRNAHDDKDAKTKGKTVDDVIATYFPEMKKEAPASEAAPAAPVTY
jgi:Flp pilus assembly protein CpaB